MNAPRIRVFAPILALVLAAGCTGPTPDRPTVLENGIKVVFNRTDSPIVCALFYMDSGEIDGPPGLATLANRLLLRGTEIRNGQQLAEEVETLGGRIGAETYFTSSIAWVQASRDGFEDCFRLLCECLSRATFDSTEVVRLQERLGRDLVFNKPPMVQKESSAIGRIRGRLFGNPRLAENPLTLLAAIPYSRDDVVRFHESAHRPERLVLAVSGKCSERSVLNTVRRAWTGRAEHAPARAVLGTVPSDGNAIDLRPKGVQDTVFIGFSGGAPFTDSFSKASILQDALSLDRTGALAACFERNGLRGFEFRRAYQFENRYAFSGMMVLVPAGSGPEARRLTRQTLDAARRGGLDDASLVIAKRKLESMLSIMSQYSLNQSYFSALAVSMDAPVRSLEAARAAVRNGTTEAIRKSAADALSGAVVWASFSRRR
jgi:predicted Zn-dependent peptidase